MTKFPILYKKDSRGNIQQWVISVTNNSYSVTEGIQGGKLTTTKSHTCEGKNLGKKNETSPAQQAEKEAQSVHDKKLRRGYALSVAALSANVFEKPMKGDKWCDREDEVIYPVTYQDKINGVNFRIKAKGVESTGGEFYHTVPHIIASVAKLFKKYPKLVLMGEGFNPKAEFLHQITEILTVVKQPKDLTPEFLAQSEKVAEAWLFDGYGFEGITETTPWIERHEAVAKLVKGFKYIYMLPYEVAKSKADLEAALADNKARKGEGLMVRWGSCPIKHGRSKYLLKMKHWEDAEFDLVRVEEGNGDWKGKAKRAVFKVPNPTPDSGDTFATNIEGSMAYLEELWNRREELPGKKATVKYQLLSEYGVPQLGWMIAIRDYEGKLEK